MLEDFQTGTASMARKRHLASSARGFYGFCLMAQIGVQEFKSSRVQLCLIRPFRGGKEVGESLRLLGSAFLANAELD